MKRSNDFPDNPRERNRHETSTIDSTDERAAVAAAFSEQRRTGNQLVIAVIPAYKEDRLIGSLVLKTRAYVDYVIVVDDGSPDQTAGVAREAGADVVVHPTREGKAKALATGLGRALQLGADLVVILGCDESHSPEEIPLVIGPILEGRADMVIGSRVQDTKSKIPAGQGFEHGSLAPMNQASGVGSGELQCGLRVFHRDALITFNSATRGMSVESEMQFWAREQGLRVVEVPISGAHAQRAKPTPMVNPVQIVTGVTGLASRARPLLFFGLAGLILILAGVGFWYRVIGTFELRHELALGHALLGTLMIIVGVLAAFQGVTLYLLRHIIAPAGLHNL